MNQVIIIRYSEIHLKGNNRSFFENKLLNNIKKSICDIVCQISKISGRYIVSGYGEVFSNILIDKLSKVFGINSVSPASVVSTNLDEITKQSILQMSNLSGTFKVITNRADKTFPINSLQLSSKLGGDILKTIPTLSVDIHNPTHQLFIDIRENGKTLIYTKVIKAVNGMPVGCSGKGLLLLSGGIDSPVAAYMMAKRGMSLRCLHFHSFPYTSPRAKQKVIDLANIIKNYTQELVLDTVSVTEIQTQINEKCPSQFMITILRRMMMRIAERVAAKHNIGAIITGESLGQVASQTLEGLTSSNAVATIPVFRPLIGFDKDEIIELATKIGTFETSIQPYEDCCTVFLPPNPATRPHLSKVELAEQSLDIDTLVNNALATLETIIL